MNRDESALRRGCQAVGAGLGGWAGSFMGEVGWEGARGSWEFPA